MLEKAITKREGLPLNGQVTSKANIGYFSMANTINPSTCQYGF